MWPNIAPGAFFPLGFFTNLPWEKYDALGLRPRNLARMFTSKYYMTAPNIDLVWPMATEILDWGKCRFSVFRQNGGQNYFRFKFRPQISTLRTWFPYMERIFRRLSASISEFNATNNFGVRTNFATTRQYDDFSQVVEPVILQPCQLCKLNSARLYCLYGSIVSWKQVWNILLTRPDIMWPSTFSVFRQHGGQNYFGFRFFVQIRILHRQLGRSSPKS